MIVRLRPLSPSLIASAVTVDHAARAALPRYSVLPAKRFENEVSVLIANVIDRSIQLRMIATRRVRVSVLPSFLSLLMAAFAVTPIEGLHHENGRVPMAAVAVLSTKETMSDTIRRALSYCLGDLHQRVSKLAVLDLREDDSAFRAK
jgi:hypothetical protein